MLKFLTGKKKGAPTDSQLETQGKSLDSPLETTVELEDPTSTTDVLEAESRLSHPESDASLPLATDSPPTKKQGGWFKRLTRGLSKTRRQLSEGIANAVLGKKVIDEALLETIESELIMADVGVAATQKFIAELTKRVLRKELSDEPMLMSVLKQAMCSLLGQVERPFPLAYDDKPFTILMVGINGSGKTTTIGKLAKRIQQDRRKVLLAAGDTFRAAAIEQLQVWGDRNRIPVIAQQSGADSAAVVFDAMEAAKARGVDVMIADTAGRLHNQRHLMEELKKIKRVMAKNNPQAPHQTLLVLDASNGQNALVQAKQFHEWVGVDGICLTKLDGTAKGGIIFSIAEQLRLPIYFIGVGEQIEDLQPFEAQPFVEALFS